MLSFGPEKEHTAVLRSVGTMNNTTACTPVGFLIFSVMMFSPNTSLTEETIIRKIVMRENTNDSVLHAEKVACV